MMGWRALGAGCARLGEVVMDQGTIQQIAREVAARLPFGDRYWLFLIINILVMALAGAATAFATAYFRTRGQNFATKHDFDELLKQQKATAEAVEKIKSDVAQRDWTQREWTNLRRVKLEALLEKMHECRVYLARQRDSAYESKSATPERDCIGEADTVAALYFPELKSEADRFILGCMKQDAIISQFRADVIASRDDLAAREVAFNVFQSHFKTEYEELLVAQNALRAAARSLLERIMNVDERPR